MAGENNNQAVRTYQKQFKELLQAVYQKQAFFREVFGGGLEALDGVENNKTAFSLKTSDIPLVIKTGDLTTKGGNAYKNDANTAFGTGTGNSSRFGDRTEIIYDDTDVNYTWDWVFHEGIDQHTVNNALQAAVADRLDLQAQEKVQMFDNQGAAYLSKSAATTQVLADNTDASIIALFNALAKAYVNMQAVGTKLAYIRPDIYNAVVDSSLSNSTKGSAVRVDENGIVTFKGFTLRETPDDKFEEGTLGFTAIANSARQFTGINTARAINSEDFDGVALQGAGKAGEFMLEANKKSLIKITSK